MSSTGLEDMHVRSALEEYSKKDLIKERLVVDNSLRAT